MSGHRLAKNSRLTTSLVCSDITKINTLVCEFFDHMKSLGLAGRTPRKMAGNLSRPVPKFDAKLLAASERTWTVFVI